MVPLPLADILSECAEPQNLSRHAAASMLEQCFAEATDADQCLGNGEISVHRVVEVILNLLRDVNFRVALTGLSVVLHLCRLAVNPSPTGTPALQHDLRHIFLCSANTSGLAGIVIEKMGDAKAAVREKAHEIFQSLRQLMPSGALHVWQLLSNPPQPLGGSRSASNVVSGFSAQTHRNPRVRMAVLVFLRKVYQSDWELKHVADPSAMSVSWNVTLTAVVELCNDSSEEVRTAAVATLAAMHKFLGVRLLDELENKHCLRGAIMAQVLEAVGASQNPKLPLSPSPAVASPSVRPQSARPATSSTAPASGTMFVAHPAGHAPSASAACGPAAGSSSSGGAPTTTGPVLSQEHLKPVRVYNEKELQKEFEKLEPLLTNVAADWSARCTALQRLSGLALGGADSMESWPALLGSVVRDGLSKQVLDLRSGIVRESCTCIGVLAEQMRDMFEPFVLDLLPSLSRMLFNGNGVIADNGHLALLSVVRNVRLGSRSLARLLELSNDAHDICRQRLGEYLRVMFDLGHLSSSLSLSSSGHLGAVLEKALDQIESVVRSMCTDRSAQVRQNGRLCWWAMNNVVPERTRRILSLMDSSLQQQIAADERKYRDGAGIGTSSVASAVSSSSSAAGGSKGNGSARPASASAAAGSSAAASAAVVSAAALPGGSMTMPAATSTTSTMPLPPSYSGAAPTPRASQGPRPVAPQTSGAGTPSSVSRSQLAPATTRPGTSVSIISPTANGLSSLGSAAAESAVHVRAMPRASLATPTAVSHGVPAASSSGVVKPTARRSLLMPNMTASRNAALATALGGGPASQDGSADSGGFTSLASVDAAHPVGSPGISSRNALGAAVAPPLLRTQSAMSVVSSSGAAPTSSSAVAASGGKETSRKQAPSLQPQSDDAIQTMDQWFDRLRSPQWTVRVECFDFLRAQFSAAASGQSFLQHFVDTTSSRWEAVLQVHLDHLNDSHHRVTTSAIDSLCSLVRLFKASAVEQHLDRILPKILMKLSDPKDIVRASASAMLETIGSVFPIDILLPLLLKLLRSQSVPKVKLATLEFLLHFVSQLAAPVKAPTVGLENEPPALWSKCVLRLLSLVDDRSQDIRSAAIACLSGCQKLYPDYFADLCHANLPLQDLTRLQRLMHVGAASASSSVSNSPDRLTGASSSSSSSSSNPSTTSNSPSTSSLASSGGSSSTVVPAAGGPSAPGAANRPVPASSGRSGTAGAAPALSRSSSAVSVLGPSTSNQPAVAPRGKGMPPVNTTAAGAGNVAQSSGTAPATSARGSSAGTPDTEFASALSAISGADQTPSRSRLAGLQFLLKKVVQTVPGPNSDSLWVSQFGQILIALLDCLRFEGAILDVPAIDASLRVLKEIMRMSEALRAQFRQYGESALHTLLMDTGRMLLRVPSLPEQRELEQLLEEVLELLVVHVLVESVALRSLGSCVVSLAAATSAADGLPPMSTEEVHRLLPRSLKLFSRVTQRTNRSMLMGYVQRGSPNILPGLFEAFKSPSADVRKAVVFVLVDMYMVLGDDFTPYLSELNTSQLKLVTIYIQRLSKSRPPGSTVATTTVAGAEY